MSTRATIKFEYEGDEYYVYRHSDGFPDVIMPDLEAAFEKAKGRWSGVEIELLITLFLAMYYNPDKQRLPDYELTRCFHGDESYCYYVCWDEENKKFTIKIN